jgi:hypothetical protein
LGADKGYGSGAFDRERESRGIEPHGATVGQRLRRPDEGTPAERADTEARHRRNARPAVVPVVTEQLVVAHVADEGIVPGAAGEGVAALGGVGVHGPVTQVADAVGEQAAPDIDGIHLAAGEGGFCSRDLVTDDDALLVVDVGACDDDVVGRVPLARKNRARATRIWESVRIGRDGTPDR